MVLVFNDKVVADEQSIRGLVLCRIALVNYLVLILVILTTSLCFKYIILCIEMFRIWLHYCKSFEKPRVVRSDVSLDRDCVLAAAA